tara:strand:- start:438 stop:1781 length:1344 start_codon:yes stop_codon:yes gene_type:complete
MRKKVMPVLTRQDIREIIVEELQFRNPDFLTEVGGDNPDGSDAVINLVADIGFALSGFATGGVGTALSTAGMAWYIHRMMESSNAFDKTLNGVVAGIMAIQTLTSVTVVGGFATGTVQGVIRAVVHTARQIAQAKTLTGTSKNVVKYYQGSKSAQVATKTLIAGLESQKANIAKIFLEVGDDGMTIGAKAIMAAAKQQGGPLANLVVDGKMAMKMSKELGRNYGLIVDDFAKMLKSILTWKSATVISRATTAVMLAAKQDTIFMNAMKIVASDHQFAKVLGSLDEPVKFVLKNGKEVLLKGLYVGDDAAKLGTVRVAQIGKGTVQGEITMGLESFVSLKNVIKSIDAAAGVAPWKRTLLQIIAGTNQHLLKTKPIYFIQALAVATNLGLDTWQLIFSGTDTPPYQSPATYEATINHLADPTVSTQFNLDAALAADPLYNQPSIGADR